MPTTAPSLDPTSSAIPRTLRDADGTYRYRLYIDGAFVDPADGR